MIEGITFWAPGLLDKLRVKEAKDVLKGLSLPALETLIAKSDKFPVMATHDFFEQASHLFHQPKAVPVAAAEAKVLFESPDFLPESEYWLKVDPVQMVADRDSLVLISAEHLAISEDESKDLLNQFNQHFNQDGVELIWGDAKNWYLSIKQPIDLQTTALEFVDNRPVNDYYPNGNAAQYWRQMINETQMLFFTHAVNEKRREQGWPEINSVWLWGEGKLNPNEIRLRDNATIWSETLYLKGLAKLTGASSLPTPKSFTEFFEINKNSNAQRYQSNHLILLDDIYQDISNYQLEEWVDRLQRLEEDWFKPMLEKVKAGEVSSAFIDLGCDYRCHIKPNHMRRFWRFKKSIEKI